MTDHFLGDAFGVLSCQFWSTVLQSGARLLIHTINCWTVQSVVARFLTGSVFECDIAHRQSVAVLCMLYKIRCNPVHPLMTSTSTICTSAGYMRCFGCTPVHLCTTSRQNLTVQQDFYSHLGVPLERSC